jgi:hypothetical protein
MDSEVKYKVAEAPNCPHCKTIMEKMDSRHLDWGTPFLWVCYNDNCAFFAKGWQHIMENYGQLSSYRYMIEPESGTCGVIPAFSAEYLTKNGKPAALYPEADE